MSKEEFLSIVSTELEKLEAEEKKAVDAVEYYSDILGGQKTENAIFQLSIIRKKIKAIRDLINLPAYTRIQAMSDAEIEEYKRGKIKELELKIKELEAEKKENRSKIEQLEAEESRLRDGFSTLSDDERARVTLRGRDIIRQISDINNKNTKLDWAIEEVRKNQQEISPMTSSQIKDRLSSETDTNYSNRKAIATVEGWDEAEAIWPAELLAAVASDPGKTMEMASLLTKYKQELDRQQKITGTLHFNFKCLPITLQERIFGSRWYEGKSPIIMYDPNKWLALIQEYEREFEEAKAICTAQFTEEKMGKLANRQMHIDNLEVDFEFFRLHADKIDVSRLDGLQSEIEERNRLSKKLIKTRETRNRIHDIDKFIRRVLTELYKQIIDWYQFETEKMGRTLGFSLPILNDRLPNLTHIMEIIAQNEKNIDSFKAKVENVKKEMDEARQVYETAKQNLAQQMRALAGEQYERAAIPTRPSSEYRENLDMIATAQGRVYQRDIVQRVQQEAQNQADMEEARLRGITVEQLLEMRKQQASIEQQATTEQGVKRI